MVAISIPLTLFSLAASVFGKQFCRSTARRDAAALQRREQHIREMKARPVRRAESSANETIIVDTYIHVIRGGMTPDEGNVPMATLQKQMVVLNKDFAKSPFVFNLTQVEYVNNTVWFEQVGADLTTALNGTDKLNEKMMRAQRQGGASTLNVFIVSLPSLAGYSPLPDGFLQNPIEDGVVVGFNYLGGVTLSHEVGHWMGLDHTFEGGCEGNGDGIDDTYPHAKPSDTCTLAPACPGSKVPRAYNIMDYLPDECGGVFTPGQIELMVYDATIFRGLWVQSDPPTGDDVSSDAATPTPPPRVRRRVSNRPSTARAVPSEARSSREPPRRIQA